MIHAVVYPQASIENMGATGKAFVYLITVITVILTILFIASMQRNQRSKQ